MPTTHPSPPRPLSLTILAYFLILSSIATLIKFTMTPELFKLDLSIILFPIIGIGLLKGNTTSQGCLSFFVIILIGAAISASITIYEIVDNLTNTTAPNTNFPWSAILTIILSIAIGYTVWKILYSKNSKAFFEHHENLQRQKYHQYHTRKPVIQALKEARHKKSNTADQ